MLVGTMVCPPPLLPRVIRSGLFLLISGALLLSLGTTFLVLTIKGKTKGIFRKFQLLTGASAIGIPLSIFLHNAIYGLLILWFGTDIWDRIGLGEDEPVFFILATIICPVAFLVGAIGSIVLTIKKSRGTRQSSSV